MKKTWIDNKKIKSKWRAEKRKEGLISGPSVPSPQPGSEEEAVAVEEDEEDEEDEDAAVADTHSDAQEETDRPAPTPVPTRQNSSRIDRKHHHTKDVPEEKTPDSLRELTREAYSRASLHSFKADPLGRHKGRGGANQRGGRGGGRGRGDMGRGGPAMGVGRGQPNMKLRMGAMLEKIKRDLA